MTDRTEPRTPAGLPRAPTKLLPRWLPSRSVTGIPSRAAVPVIALAIGCVLILILSFALPADSFGATLLLEHTRESPFPYPFTIQNFMHLLFCVGLGETVRHPLEAARAGTLTPEVYAALRSEDTRLNFEEKLSQMPDYLAGWRKDRISEIQKILHAAPRNEEFRR